MPAASSCGSGSAAGSGRHGRRHALAAAGPADADSRQLQTCKFCRRTSECDNPCPRRHLGQYLRFTSNHSAECLNCRNFTNSCCKHKSRAELAQGVQDDGKHSSYMKGFNDFERIFDEAEGKQLRNIDDQIEMPEWITLTTEICT